MHDVRLLRWALLLHIWLNSQQSYYNGNDAGRQSYYLGGQNTFYVEFGVFVSSDDIYNEFDIGGVYV